MYDSILQHCIKQDKMCLISANILSQTFKVLVNLHLVYRQGILHWCLFSKLCLGVSTMRDQHLHKVQTARLNGIMNGPVNTLGENRTHSWVYTLVNLTSKVPRGKMLVIYICNTVPVHILYIVILYYNNYVLRAYH